MLHPSKILIVDDDPFDVDLSWSWRTSATSR